MTECPCAKHRCALRPVVMALLLLAVVASQHDALADAVHPVRKAGSGICHDATSPSYDQIKDYTTYRTLTECVASGGRLPKNVCVPCKAERVQAGRALYDTDDVGIVKKSRDGICYDARHGSFSRIVEFTAYANLDDCVAAGGRQAAP